MPSQCCGIASLRSCKTRFHGLYGYPIDRRSHLAMVFSQYTVHYSRGALVVLTAAPMATLAAEGRGYEPRHMPTHAGFVFSRVRFLSLKA